MSSSQENLQSLVNAVSEEGAAYGLEINWDKTFQMGICTPSTINRPDGSALEKKRELIYLGGLITCDGRVNRELNRRLGEGRSILNELRKLWSHANLGHKRKIEIFNACVTSKVMYALDSLWLLKADKKRLDGFQCACLRKCLRIAPSYVSRISNAEVYARSNVVRYSTLLEHRQKELYQNIQLLPVGTALRSLVCDVRGQPIIWCQRRSRGRPQQRWAHEVFRLVCS